MGAPNRPDDPHSYSTLTHGWMPTEHQFSLPRCAQRDRHPADSMFYKYHWQLHFTTRQRTKMAIQPNQITLSSLRSTIHSRGERCHLHGSGRSLARRSVLVCQFPSRHGFAKRVPPRACIRDRCYRCSGCSQIDYVENAGCSRQCEQLLSCGTKENVEYVHADYSVLLGFRIDTSAVHAYFGMAQRSKIRLGATIQERVPTGKIGGTLLLRLRVHIRAAHRTR